MDERLLEYDKDRNIMGIKVLKSILREDENKGKKEVEVDNKFFGPKIDHYIWMTAMKD